MSLSLMAIQCSLPGDWLRRCEKALTSAGYQFVREGSRLVVLDDIKVDRGLQFSDGFYLQRMWLGPRMAGIGALAKRVYFDASGEILRQQEFLILNGRKRPDSSSSWRQLEHQSHALQQLIFELNDFGASWVQLSEVGCDTKNARTISIGNSEFDFDGNALNTLFKNHGFARTPNPLSLTVCTNNEVSESNLQRLISSLRSTSTARGVHLNLDISSMENIRNQLDTFDMERGAKRSGHSILFLLSSSDAPLDHEIQSLMNQLEERGISFRRAYSSDPYNFSVPDQIASIVKAAGGRAYSINSKIFGRDLWSIGIDLGHSKRDRFSNLAVSLVDPQGGLIKVWSSRQRLDETASTEALKAGLQRCRRHLLAEDRSPAIVVMRDGRFLENENQELYFEHLGDEVSLLEFRKRGNPQILKRERESNYPIEQPIAASFPGSNILFMVTQPSRGRHSLAAISKVVWRDSWNRLDLGQKEISELILASACAPGLGLRPHVLPAPLYWADGVGKTAAGDLRFRGQPIERLC